MRHGPEEIADYVRVSLKQGENLRYVLSKTAYVFGVVDAAHWRPDAHERLTARAARAVRVTRRGRSYGYPPCCIARFAYDVLRGARAGVRRGYPDCPWVPCEIWHHAPR